MGPQEGAQKEQEPIPGPGSPDIPRRREALLIGSLVFAFCLVIPSSHCFLFLFLFFGQTPPRL